MLARPSLVALLNIDGCCIVSAIGNTSLITFRSIVVRSLGGVDRYVRVLSRSVLNENYLSLLWCRLRY